MITEAVINCFFANRKTYGRIRLKKEMAKVGIQISEHKISRILKENGLLAKGGRPRKSTRKEKPTEAQYIEENLIKDKFAVAEANYLWCCDNSEFTCRDGKFYVCGILDVATRRAIGWAIAKHQRQELVHESFLMAVGRNPVRPEGAVFHSDRGCQFTSKKTKELVEKYGFRKSMSRPGTPSDNQPIESFWNTMKRELPEIKNMTFDEASHAIASYIELFYNSSRLHSSIGYLTPNQKFSLLSVH